MVSRIVAGVVIALAVATVGQSQPLGKQLISKELESEFNKTYTRRIELINGVKPYVPGDQKLLALMSLWYIQRVTLPDAQTNHKVMEKVHQNFEQELINPATSQNAKNNTLFVEQLGKPLAKSFKDVLSLPFDNDNRMAIVNAALMLPPAARLKQDDLGDYLVELARDKDKHDAVKVYAVKALREFLPAHMSDDNDEPSDKKLQKKAQRDIDRIAALSEYIHRKWPPTTDEGEIDAIRYLRREAATSLGQVGVPAVANLKKKGIVQDGIVQGPAAYELLRVLVRSGKDALEPPTSLSERLEAAIGLCHLKNPATVGYDPSVSVYAVAICFLEYAEEYSKDYPNLKDRKDPTLKNLPFKSRVPTMAFRINTERFKHAMKDLLANSQGTPALANAKKLEPNLMKMANDMSKYNSVQSDLQIFSNVVKSLAPKTGILYQRGKGPELDPATLVPPVVAAKDDDK